jgi:hypothetical protein
VRAAVDKREWRRIRNEIQRVLPHGWDPLGVKDFAAASGEYNNYVGRVFTPLAQHQSDEAILEYLLGVETERMGVTGTTKQELAPTLQALREIRF